MPFISILNVMVVFAQFLNFAKQEIEIMKTPFAKKNCFGIVVNF